MWVGCHGKQGVKSQPVSLILFLCRILLSDTKFHRNANNCQQLDCFLLVSTFKFAVENLKMSNCNGFLSKAQCVPIVLPTVPGEDRLSERRHWHTEGIPCCACPAEPALQRQCQALQEARGHGPAIPLFSSVHLYLCAAGPQPPSPAWDPYSSSVIAVLHRGT